MRRTKSLSDVTSILEVDSDLRKEEEKLIESVETIEERDILDIDEPVVNDKTGLGLEENNEPLLNITDTLEDGEIPDEEDQILDNSEKYEKEEPKFGQESKPEVDSDYKSDVKVESKPETENSIIQKRSLSLSDIFSLTRDLDFYEKHKPKKQEMNK